MNRLRTLAVALVVFTSTALAWGQGQDVRRRYGTNSLVAAQALSRAITLSQSKKPAAAMAAVSEAIKADPTCQLAHYWHAIISSDLGDVDKAIASFKKSYALRHPPTGGLNVTMDTALNLGLTLGMLGRYDESNIWFTNALLTDPADTTKTTWKAYRNMMVNLLHQKRNFSAALAAVMGNRANSQRVTDRVVMDLLDKIGDEEVARLHYIETPSPPPAARATETKLTEASLPPAAAAVTGISSFLPDPQGRYVIAMGRNLTSYAVIRTGGAIKATTVDVGLKIICGCLMRGRLFLVVDSKGGKLIEVDIDSGKAVRTLNLGSHLPGSIAVVPEAGVVYFPGSKKEIQQLDLASGEIATTGEAGQIVAVSGEGKYLFSCVMPDLRARHHTVIINGRPVFLQDTRIDWRQATLFQHRIVARRLVPMAIRFNAASNTSQIIVSPDGRWVTLPGGGGWRPAFHKGPKGYGVAVFDSENIERLQGFFATGAYPRTCAFNAVTQQVAAGRSADITVYHLSDPKAKTVLKGKFNAATWSGDGAFLVLARDGKLAVYANELLPPEKALAATWWKALQPAGTKTTVAIKTPKPMASLAKFTVRKTRTEAQTMLRTAIARKATAVRPSWRTQKLYTGDDAITRQLDQVLQDAGNPDRTGIIIYRLRKLLKEHPRFTPGSYHLAVALDRSGQKNAARAGLLSVIRVDAGRSSLTDNSLRRLAASYAQTEPMAAIYCLAAALSLDAIDPATTKTLLPLLAKHNLTMQARQIKGLGDPRGDIVITEALPALAKPDRGQRDMSPSSLFRKVSPSVVVVQAGNRSGTGICVGRPGIILTNEHIIHAGHAVSVQPYAYKDGKLTALAKLEAKILYRSSAEDIAVLSIAAPPRSLLPLPVAAADPTAGVKVYAIGHPGLGDKVLAHTFSDGIVSAPRRTLDGQGYIQHTAAINRGNSGGPLLDLKGRVLGVNTLKAGLQNVNFAIPASKIREVFARGRPK